MVSIKAKLLQQEVYKQDSCAPTAIAMIRAMCKTVDQLHKHIQWSQQQQSSLPALSVPVTSDIHWLSDFLEGKVAAGQQMEQATRKSRARSKLNGLVKAFKPSLRQGALKESSALAEPSRSECASQAYPVESLETPVHDEHQLKRQSALREGLTELQSSREGQQRLLKALLQLEGMRVLDKCLAACLSCSHPFDRDLPRSKLGSRF